MTTLPITNPIINPRLVLALVAETEEEAAPAPDGLGVKTVGGLDGTADGLKLGKGVGAPIAYVGWTDGWFVVGLIDGALLGI